MCRGRGEEDRKIRRNSCSKASRREILCELCSSMASIYCLADGAFLCEKCDIEVHAANFLSHRHIRCLLCGSCQGFTRRHRAGTSPSPLKVVIIHRRKRKPYNM